MRALHTWIVAGALAVAAPACKKDEPAKPAAPAAEQSAGEEETEEAEAPEQAQPAARPERPVVAPGDRGIKVLSVDEHMEAVSKQITADNYKDELARLEAQIDRRAERPAPDADAPDAPEQPTPEAAP